MLTISRLLWVLFFTVNICWAYKGLYIMNHGTRSHLSFHKAILETLSESGHKITFVTPYNTKFNIKNVTEILLKENWTDKLLGNPFNNSNDLSLVWKFLEYGPKSCTGPLGDPAMQKALEEDYDYVLLSIFLSECFLTVPYVKKCSCFGIPGKTDVAQCRLCWRNSHKRTSAPSTGVGGLARWVRGRRLHLFLFGNSYQSRTFKAGVSKHKIHSVLTSLINLRTLPWEIERHISSILKVFGSLKQRILWKWNSEIENLPSNIKISSWLPQQDILAHPKIRLFISHGGLFGSQEAMYFEVPVLGMPVFLDQHMNIDEIVSQGWGKSISWDNLTEENFAEAIQDILSNSSIREKAHERSVLMRDWPRTPKEEVFWWLVVVRPMEQNTFKNLSPIYMVRKFYFLFLNL
ncbi:putative UDP-glucosyltransferase YojK [Armadillidium vulgare]|nr:putative UDP-glucosyltransferase YojK [Armadillidium vulgare]